MKTIAFYLLNLVLLTALVSCGKDNESGKSNAYVNGYGNPYGAPGAGYSGYYPYTGQPYSSYPLTTSPYSYGNVAVNTIMQQAPCTTGFAPQGRMPIQLQLNNFSYIAPGEVYAAVTSMGDVAVVVGQGNTSPLFVAYVCQRGMLSNGQGQLVDLAIGASTRCAIKDLTRATMILPGAYEPLYFRTLMGGIGIGGQRFSFCY